MLERTCSDAKMRGEAVEMKQIQSRAGDSLGLLSCSVIICAWHRKDSPQSLPELRCLLPRSS